MAGNVTAYLNLIAPEHNQKPNYIASVTAAVQPFADQLAVLSTFATLWDVDSAVGDQLDTIGLWVGISREIAVPLTGVYFSFDDASLGFDLGIWLGPFDPTSGLVSLPDDSYRLVIKAKIGLNHWDGSIPDAYAFMNPLFPGNQLVIQDNQDMTMLMGIIGPNALTPIETALLENGYLDVKPAGVTIDAYITPSVPNAPFFGFDVENSTISGFDVGGWATLAPGR